ncbi:MAG: outer membrane beta-barrel protein [Bdellovibrionales bacterium]
MQHLKILSFIFLISSSSAFAQEWGATLGFHQTTADSNDSTATVDGKLNFKLGALVWFELVEGYKFRSGAIFSQRHIDINKSGYKYEYNFDYFDVPANVQYNFNEMIGVFGGLTFAINFSDDVDAPSGAPANTDQDAEKMIPIMNGGVNFLFNDMIGFDVYYERGMGRFAKNLENHSTFGANFIYWF